ncbi:MAG: hypothetical protein IPM97_14325 [Bdellovibrionaceae bacterium]|nr:hypothetical protein [Pseudobdellovibrionaceae bacterium]
MRVGNPDWKFLVATAFLVAIVAVPTLASLFSKDEQDVPVMVLRPQEQKVRKPASLIQGFSPKKAVVIEDAAKELNNVLGDNLITYNLKCPKSADSKNFKVQGSYVQLRGLDCNQKTHAGKISIVNKTNGFTASVFLLDGKNYQTDLIQLKEGENQIYIRYQSLSSEKEEEYVLNVKSGTT